MLGGFFGLIARVTAWILKFFNAFNLDSSMANKLYSYKKKEDQLDIPVDKSEDPDEYRRNKIKAALTKDIVSRSSITPSYTDWYLK